MLLNIHHHRKEEKGTINNDAYISITSSINLNWSLADKVRHEIVFQD